MEAVPRLPMLSFDLRTSVEKVDFSTKLKHYIRSHYNEDPAMYAAGITGIDALRREAVNPSKSIAGCSSMKRYFCQLHLAASRFPMRENEEASMLFTWKNLYNNSTVTLNDVSLEMASILYNIGALHSHLGAIDSRTSAEGMKMSCTHFQCAAWAFQHINEEYPFPKKFGLSPVLMSFMCHLSLAQAQECILEKSMKDNRKSGITAKVGIQVVDYYKQSLSLLLEWPHSEDNPSDISGLKAYKNWHKYVLFKIAYYESISLLFQGQQSADQQKMGERITFYQAAFEKLEEAKKLVPSVENTESITDALTFVHDVIEGKRKAAKNENEFIYHEDVPSLAHLPKVKGASLVKGISFNINDPEVCGPDLFSNIVPMQAHESASLYSEEKAKLLRRINGLIENKDEELETFLSMLDLDEIQSKMDGNKLPQELIDRCASMSAKPNAIENLTAAMGRLSDVYQDVGGMLIEIKEMLQEEDNHEKDYQKILGKRPPTIAATDLTREAKKYQEAHAKASESNQTLHKAMLMHISNLKLLSLPLKELISHIPTINENSDVQAVSKEMQHLISKIDEMKQQRLLLAGQLRDLVCQDDITRQVITFSGERIEDLFDQELKKYDKYVSLIEQNLVAQENILRSLKDVYARFGSTRKSTSELHKRRSAIISSLIASYDAYEDLLSKSSKGLDFYKKLETNVSKLLQRVKGTCKVQDEEREQMLKSFKNVEPVLPQTIEVPAPTTLKLKDYLNIKKETGKLTLIEPSNPSVVVPVTQYYNDLSANQPQSNWVPGTRPAPVGSEETETSFKTNPSDTFHGFYQSEGKDQIWNNTNYTAPQNADQKLKYFLPQATGAPSGYSQNPSYVPGQDAYPISSYSTVLPKSKGQVSYEPKSNYYDIQGSPNRCYNPTQPNADAGCSNFGSDMSTCYVYSNQLPGSYPASHQSYATSMPQPDLSLGTYGTPSQSVDGAAGASPNYNPATFQQPHLPYGSTEPGQVVYTPSLCPSSQVQQSTAYNSYAKVSTPPTYATSVNDQSSTYSGNYQTPGATTTATFMPQDQTPNYQGCQNYQTPVTSFSAENHMDVPQPSYSYGVAASSSFPGYQSTAMQYGQFSASIGESTWSNAYLSDNQQYLQSGNESLYTASQTPNQYAMTNSDVYKPPESQDSCQPSQYGNQYYNNQYGAYNGQMEVNNQNGNPVTYMQAGTDKQQAVTTTTFSYPGAKSSPVTNPSNVDLLAGLDFSISQSPLVPEKRENVPVSKEEELKPESPKQKPSPIKSTPEPVKLKLGNEVNEETPKDWTMVPENLTSFAQEVGKYEKFVEGLTLRTLGGPSNLEIKWKEIADFQEKISPQHIISVARCYPMKNRFPDILPYDDSRVELPSTKDDYINASKMTALTELTPTFILTQAPLPSTYADFWAMVFEQQVEVVVCLLSDVELNGHIYWPQEKGQEVEMGKLKVSLQSCNVRSHWVERILFLSGTESKATRVVVHLQFTAWPGSSFPESPGPFLTFSTECKNLFTQQRSSCHPVVVHCISGVGRTGLFCLIVASIQEIQAGRGIPDLAGLFGRMCEFRKSCPRDREHLKFAYQAVLHYCQDFLIKHGIPTSKATYQEKKLKDSKSQSSVTSSTSDGEQLQAGIERLQLGRSIEIPLKKNIWIVEEPQARKYLTNPPVASFLTHPLEEAHLQVLLLLNSINFSLKLEPNQKKKKFTPDSFNNGSKMEVKPSDNDPLSQLDPLWSIKK
ncbi:hypothetical protein RUM43_008490 [Polyplax serrata]|uniref:Tyrosine-protein phosphatase non-receptor type 23 n=1 Tax=Polyplax serrata TaxID=468196 RepID=A0AAN8P9E9_POLSC